MQIIYEPELKAYMNQKGKKNIVVEIASSDSSDFSVEEFYIHFADEKLADSFIKRKGYRAIDTDMGSVLFPNYRLEYDDIITFGIKKVLFFHKITMKGIRF